MISGIVRKSKRVVSFERCPRCKGWWHEFYLDKSRDPVWYDVIKCSQCGFEVTGYGALAEEWEVMSHERWWKLRKIYWAARAVSIYETKGILDQLRKEPVHVYRIKKED